MSLGLDGERKKELCNSAIAGGTGNNRGKAGKRTALRRNHLFKLKKRVGASTISPNLCELKIEIKAAEFLRLPCEAFNRRRVLPILIC